MAELKPIGVRIGDSVRARSWVRPRLRNARCILRVERLEKRCLLTYTITDLGSIGTETSHGYGINNKGEATGSVFITKQSEHAFLYSNGTMKDIGVLGQGTHSLGVDINDSGQIAGYSSFRPMANATFRGFLYSNGIMTDLGTLGGLESRAEDINNQGIVVGYSQVTEHDPYSFIYHGFAYDDMITAIRPMSFASAINDRGDIAGPKATPSRITIVLYQDGVFTDLGCPSDYLGCDVADMNNKGEIVGRAVRYRGTTQIIQSFVYRNGQFEIIGSFGRPMTRAFGINEAGDVVGYAETQGKNDHRPFLYRNGQLTDLNDLISPDSGWHIITARGINDHGQIVGTAINREGYGRAIILTPERSDRLHLGAALHVSYAVSATVQPDSRGSHTSPVIINPFEQGTKSDLTVEAVPPIRCHQGLRCPIGDRVNLDWPTSGHESAAIVGVAMPG